MQWNCETEEFEQLFQMMIAPKLEERDRRIEELTKKCQLQEDIIANQKQEIDNRDATINELREKFIELSKKMNDAAMAAWTINQFLVLSQQKAQIYAQSVDNNTRAHVGQFLFQSLPDNAPQVQIEFVRTITQPEAPPPPLINDHRTFNATGDVVIEKHVDYEVGHVETGGTGIGINKETQE